MIKSLLQKILGGEPLWDTSERRGGVRVRANFELELACPPSTRYLGTVLDLSAAGLRMRIRGPWNGKVLKRDTVVSLRHTNPPFDAELDAVRATVRWVKKEGEALFQVALAYADPPDVLRRSWVKSVLVASLGKSIRQKREHLRVAANLQTTVTADGQPIKGNLRDVSSRGARFEAFTAIPVGTTVTVRLPGLSPIPEMKLSAVVRRSELSLGTHNMGLAFLLDDQQKKQLVLLVRKMVEIKKKTSL